jgi:hypothetical protein
MELSATGNATITVVIDTQLLFPNAALAQQHSCCGRTTAELNKIIFRPLDLETA